MSDSRREATCGSPLPSRNSELIARYKSGDRSALDELVVANERLTRGVTRMLAAQVHIKTSSDLFEDLLQEGRFGVFLAARSFDPSKSTLFTSHARNWIVRQVGYYINTKIGTIHVPSGDKRIKSQDLKDQSQKFRFATAPGGARPKADPLGLLESVDPSRFVELQEEREDHLCLIRDAAQSLTPTQKFKVLDALKGKAKIPAGPKRRTWARSMDCAVKHMRETLRLTGVPPQVRW